MNAPCYVRDVGTDCDWKPDDLDANGQPVYRPNRQAWFGEKTHVTCAKCGARSYCSREEIAALLSTASRHELR